MNWHGYWICGGPLHILSYTFIMGDDALFTEIGCTEVGSTLAPHSIYTPCAHFFTYIFSCVRFYFIYIICCCYCSQVLPFVGRFCNKY